MAYLVLVILTLLSCWLFEFSKLPQTLKTLTASYKQQFKVMGNKTLDDEEKQKQLMALVSQQLKGIGKLILGILLFIAPFFSLFLLQRIHPDLNPEILVKWWGLLIPIATVILYMILKKNYGKLLGK